MSTATTDSVANCRHIQDSLFVVPGFKPIEVALPHSLNARRGWHGLGRIANSSLCAEIPVGLKIRGAKQIMEHKYWDARFSARIAEELIAISALQRSTDLDGLLPLFTGLAVDQDGRELGILTEDLSENGLEEDWPVTELCVRQIDGHDPKLVLKGMKLAFGRAGYAIDDWTLNNHALMSFGNRLGACDLEDIVDINREPAKTDFGNAFRWVQEGHLSVPVTVRDLDE